MARQSDTMKDGLPKDLADEAYAAYFEVYSKYRGMRKRHMNKDRIVGIMLASAADARRHYETGAPPCKK